MILYMVLGTTIMKKFIYCESTEGGMEEYYIDSLEELGLYGWMSETCKEDDEALVEWSLKAEVGEYYEHRLGMCFRVSCA
jgi:hypothetical protein